eukprot:3855494-Prymnesium_polylepis.2
MGSPRPPLTHPISTRSRCGAHRVDTGRERLGASKTTRIGRGARRRRHSSAPAAARGAGLAHWHERSARRPPSPRGSRRARIRGRGRRGRVAGAGCSTG